MATDPSGLIAQLLSPQGINGFQQSYEAAQNNLIQRQAAQQQLAAGALQLQQAQQQQAQAQQYQQDVNSWIQSGSSPDGLVALATRYPDQAKNLQASWKLKDDAQTKGDQTFYGQVYSAANNGRTDLVTKLLQQRQQALKGAGQDTSSIDDTLQDLASNPQALDHVKSYTLSQIYGSDPDGFAKAFGIGGDKDSTHVINPGGALVDNTGRELYRAGGKATYEKIKNADGSESIVRIDGDQGASGQNPSPSGTTGGSGAPLSVRLNNPGAIRANPNNNWQGQVGQQNGFVQFDTPENGARAHRILIGNQIKNGFDTPLTWAQHYAPASDGNDPAAYAQTIASGLGIGVNDKIPLSAVPKVAQLSAQVESGGSPSTQAQGTSVTPGASVIFTGKGNTPVDDSLTGPAFLKSLPQGRANLLNAINDGRAPAPRPGSKFGEALTEDLARAFPGVDLTQFPARQQALKDFTGNGKAAQTISSFNRFASHLNSAWENSQALGGANLGPLSGVAASISQSFDPAHVKAYNTEIEALQGEFQKLTKNGVGSESEAQRLIDQAKAAQSLTGRNAALQALARLVQGQYAPIHQQWASAFGDRPLPTDITPASEAVLNNILSGKAKSLPTDSHGTPYIPKAPPGTKQVGTYQGNPVYEYPNGRRVVGQ